MLYFDAAFIAKFYLQEAESDAIDALHLTCARRHGHEHIYSNDRHLLLAAPHFGLQPGLLRR